MSRADAPGWPRRRTPCAAYALADVLDGQAHLEQVTVHPEYGRRGIGRQIVDQVADWARAQGFRSMTLLTFCDVAWNGPYYRRLGFVDVPDAEMGPELARLRAHEAGSRSRHQHPRRDAALARVDRS